MITHADGSKDSFEVAHTFNAEQIEWFRAGSALNNMKFTMDGKDITPFIFGDVVNTASRLQSLAPEGAVIVGEPTQSGTRHLIEYEARPWLIERRSVV